MKRNCCIKYMSFQILFTDTFKRTYQKLDRSEQEWIERMLIQMQESPSGKMIRYSWFREKKYLNKRLYFLVDEEQKKVMIIDFGSKKEQPKTIAHILSHMQEYLNYFKDSWGHFLTRPWRRSSRTASIRRSAAVGARFFFSTSICFCIQKQSKTEFKKLLARNRKIFQS